MIRPVPTSACLAGVCDLCPTPDPRDCGHRCHAATAARSTDTSPDRQGSPSVERTGMADRLTG